ncbi:hypothetical protein BFR04_11770 [Gaetbulibacter sp. 4G1]|nr:hypothetical protein [Gaetbulibacter sp. 4G1]PIA81977.1 hypothetical protein BFR04_11770 [Gaetbulibacter sp. 4G1]
MKNLIFTTAVFLFALITSAQDSVSISDFEILNDTKWEGKLTYLDYQSGKLTSIETKLQVSIEGNRITSNIQYVYEPNKNNKSSVSIRKNGTLYGNEKVISNKQTNDTRTIITSYKGKDNGKKATIFITYKFNKNNYTISKKVVYKDGSESVIRNTYSFTKTK